MIIGSSNVAMTSDRTYSYYAQTEGASLTTMADKAATAGSTKQKSLLEQLQENRTKLLEQEQQETAKNTTGMSVENSAGQEATIKTIAELKAEVLRQILQIFQSNKRTSFSDYFRNGAYRTASLDSMPVSDMIGNNVTMWQRTTVASAFVSEEENTAYTAQGLVKTADGRSISFGVNLEMSRSFCASFESMVKEDYLMTDPLVIHMQGYPTGLTEQKFLFDLDSDGSKEIIPFAGEGSGFLALDNNGDGIINDGSELFGTKSGDGFADLAVHDRDKNGWIDEADEVFSRLRVWTKDEFGNDKLMSLKDAGIGAICLQSAETDFSLNDAENRTQGRIRRTGLFLHENGDVGTIQHVDIAV